MNRLALFAGGAIALVLIVVAGSQVLPPGGTGGAGAGAVGGTVDFELDGAPATTEVDAFVDGGTVSGTAVTTFRAGTHTVRLECAARDGDTWAFGGTTEQSTVPGERAGAWSAVVVRDPAPQQIVIWLSDSKSEGRDCDGWLASIQLAGIDAELFRPVKSGKLVPPR